MTTFVANFLGQSNLLSGTVVGKSGGDVLVDVNGRRLALPTSRVHTDSTQVHVGVRPEKIQIAFAADAVAHEGHNVVEGVVTDSSFTGVSTQYQVRLPWGQEVMVFAQNMSRDERLVTGSTAQLQWDPAHTFALDATQSVAAGSSVDDEAAAPDPVVV